ncbi:MAG: bifunctional diaminohydroxyphosphoribosylaminopyrimidine deaminase/5-amino-6-(5-phosphoribosylamino)uracil reductase RibD [Chloroflexi bacterium]|nr:bifunctional diaminohydroxyphosphoribosylaminopyrimidine deaminase/5-amino-6-(5-phosphoribosylamino)uracil reductase RibD [Chloroflexota bacterium]
MGRALALARQALGTTSPNPAVGAVVVKGGVAQGEGYTQPPGGAHAEVVALAQAGEGARGASLYVTLEPCPHFGHTPPCTMAIIAAGITEVHMATLDPNPLVWGRGKRDLEAAGIKTHVGELEEEAQELNEAYFKYITMGSPFIIAKFAMSLDGKMATKEGEAKWITGPAARDRAHDLRRTVDAIMVGVNTVLADDPQLNYRRSAAGEAQKGDRQPLRVVVDSEGRIPATAGLFKGPGSTLLVTALSVDEVKAQKYAAAGAEVMTLTANGRVDLHQLLKMLGEREITSLLVEGGGTLLGSLFDLRLVDKVVAFVAPMIIGGREALTPVEGEGVSRLAEALRLARVKVERLGDDIMIVGYVKRD